MRNNHLREEVTEREKTLAECEEQLEKARDLVDCWRDDVAIAYKELIKAQNAAAEHLAKCPYCSANKATITPERLREATRILVINSDGTVEDHQS